MFGEVELKSFEDLGIVGGRKTAIAAICEQESAEWFALRIGILSASHADLCVTSTGKVSKGQSRQSYINGLIAERLTGTVEMGHESLAMERGKNLEKQARDWYAFESGTDVLQVGFVFPDEKKGCGCSPDGLRADGRGVEIKCPLRKEMISILLKKDVPAGYLSQIHMSLWVTGLPVWDLCFYTPEPQIPNRIWTIDRDETIMKVYDESVPVFLKEIADGEAWIREAYK